jgi:hypothetical protein
MKPKKLITTALLALGIFVYMGTVKAYAAPIAPSGSGTLANAYKITNTDNLEWMSQQVITGNTFAGRYFEMSNDIDANLWTATPVGDFINCFAGKFDGKNHKISNLTIAKPKVGMPQNSFVALFPSTTSGAELKNLGLENVNMSGFDQIAALVGMNNGGIIDNCYSTGVVSGSNNMGGLISSNIGGSIINSHSSVNITSDCVNVGGLVGGNQGTIANSYATGNVNGVEVAGGLVGSNDGIVRNSYATGGTTGTKYVGGLIGRILEGSTVENCYTAGDVSGTSYVGAVAGTSVSVVNFVYWNSNATILESGNPIVIGVAGGVDTTISKPLIEIKTEAFVTLLNLNAGSSGWDLTPGVNNDLPILLLLVGAPEVAIGGTSDNIDIIGLIDATIIELEVPLTINFTIRPNSIGAEFVSVPFIIDSKTSSPVTVEFLGFKSQAGTITKVANPHVRTKADYAKMTRSQSEAELALGLKDGLKPTIWSPAEVEHIIPDVKAGEINIDRLSNKVINLECNTGNSWKEAKELKYVMYLRVTLLQ